MSATPELDELRRTLQERGLRRADLATDPMEQFRRWFDEATEAGLHEPEARTAETEARFAGIEIPRPPHWGGYRVVPSELEVWQGRPDRLHDRFRYIRDPSSDLDADADQWTIARLSP